MKKYNYHGEKTSITFNGKQQMQQRLSVMLQ